MSLASLKVCLAACLLHWSRLQKGAHSTFDETDLKKICDYTECCKKIALESDFIDIIVCTYGTVMKEKEQYKCEGFRLPRMTILLVNSNQTQDVEAQKQRIAELMNMFPELANSVLNNIDTVTNMANNVFQKIFDIYKDDKLSIEMKSDCLLQQHKALEVSHNINIYKKMLFCCMHCCVFYIIFFHEFYLRISTSSQAEFHLTHIFDRLALA